MALNPLVSPFGRLVAHSSRIKVDRHTDGRTDGRKDRTTTVTLAAHARRGLITQAISDATLLERSASTIN